MCDLKMYISEHPKKIEENKGDFRNQHSIKSICVIYTKLKER